MHPKIKHFVDTNHLPLDTQLRAVCPMCGGKNTFSIKKTFKGYLWRCFRASCDLRGKDTTKLSGEEIKNSLILGSTAVEEPKPFHIPEYFSHITNNMLAQEYLKDVNAWEAFQDGRLDVRYDPHKDRVVFMVMYKGACLGAAGRAVERRRSPKWWNYHQALSQPFLVPHRGFSGFPQHGSGVKWGIVVEDCASAAAASGIADGIALLGTNVNPAYHSMLRSYDFLVLSLDRDATKKAFQVHKEISMLTKCNIHMLEKDVKFYTQQQLLGIYEKYVDKFDFFP